MEFDQYFVVLLRKGPIWTAEPSLELDKLQEAHLAHLRRLRESGKMALSGPVEVHGDGDYRGISLYYPDKFANLEELRAAVEQDPMIRIGRLVAEYLTWHLPKGSMTLES
jgi:uncharacterized protein YciI